MTHSEPSCIVDTTAPPAILAALFLLFTDPEDHQDHEDQRDPEDHQDPTITDDRNQHLFINGEEDED